MDAIPSSNSPRSSAVKERWKHSFASGSDVPLCPLLMVFEDAHWADPTSLELFGRMVNKIARHGSCC